MKQQRDRKGLGRGYLGRGGPRRKGVDSVPEMLIFTRELTSRPLNPKPTDVLVPALELSYGGVYIALFTGEGLDAQADAYIETYGYLAAWRREWNLGNRVGWSEDLRVVM